MAKFRVLVDSIIGTGLVKAGEVIEYDGVSEGAPGHNLELIPEVLPKVRNRGGGNQVGPKNLSDMSNAADISHSRGDELAEATVQDAGSEYF